MVIAIDGPAGSGKSTMAKLLAKKMGYIYLDTGAMYRICTLKLMNEGVDLNKISYGDIEVIKKYIDNIDMEIKNDSFYLDGVNVSEQIREPKISENVSKVAAIEYIREKMVDLQREFSKGSDTILDGRDIGTVVFPNADVKFFLVADAKKRAERRYNELTEKGVETSFDEIYKNILLRDQMDMERAVSPLKKAYDAIEIDTTDKSIEEVCEKMIKYINKI